LETPQQIAGALNLLEHFHLAHSSGNVTRFTGASGCDVFVTADPVLKAKLLELCKSGGAELGAIAGALPVMGRRGEG
jgi:hypothetical protein